MGDDANKKGLSHKATALRILARLTGLEPATPGVTGRYSNQLSYNRTGFANAMTVSYRLAASASSSPATKASSL